MLGCASSEPTLDSSGRKRTGVHEMPHQRSQFSQRTFQLSRFLFEPVWGIDGFVDVLAEHLNAQIEGGEGVDDRAGIWSVH